MEGKRPEEVFPAIGTVENPAVFHDGRDLLLCYEVAPVDDGGTVVLAFSDVIFFEQNPHNVPEGLRDYKYPIDAWDFTEVWGSDRNERWGALGCRFWTISFNDVAVEIVFSEVRQLHRVREPNAPHDALLEFLRTEYRSTPPGR